MTRQTEAMGRLGIRYPIVQGPFGGGLSTARLVAAVSERGGLGSFGAHMLDPHGIETVAREIRALTGGPFALNLWVSDHDPGGIDVSAAAFDRAWRVFEPLYAEYGLAKPALPESRHPRFADQVEALLEARPPVFSFVFGIPPASVLAACRQRGIVTAGAATTLAEAEALAAAGVDLIVATGFEAGGHRPAFLAAAEDSLVGTLSLVRLAARRVDVPVIAAGGIVDAQGISAVLALGAQAAQIGTAFLATSDSGTVDAHRAALFGDEARRTVLTRAYTGRLARGIPNRLTAAFAAAGTTVPFPLHSVFVGPLREAAIAAGSTDFVSLYAGQSAAGLDHRRAADLMDALIAGLAGAPAAAA